jgi:H+/Cl- antiporter ClcA
LNLNWSWWQWVLAAFLALDMGGGAVANCLNSAKRFYHAPPAPDDSFLSKLARRPLVFAAIHIHPVAAALAFAPAMLGAGVAWYVAMMAASALVRVSPLALARPIAAFAVTAAIVVSSGPGFVTGLEWLPAVLFVKIVFGHMVREEPYGR